MTARIFSHSEASSNRKMADRKMADRKIKKGEWGVGSGEWGMGYDFPISPLPIPHSPLPLLYFPVSHFPISSPRSRWSRDAELFYHPRAGSPKLPDNNHRAPAHFLKGVTV